MGFKLIRIDTNEPCKVPLKVGTHVIGRGDSLLNCEDQRVSRNHAVIKVTDDSVILKSLHQNPCFYNKLNSQKTLVLNKGKWVSLSNADHFGLLPESYWFELIFGDNLPCLNPNSTNTQVEINASGDHNLTRTEFKIRTPSSEINIPTRATNYYNNKYSYTYKPECDDDNETDTLNLEFEASMEGGESQPLIASDNGDDTNCDTQTTPSKRPHTPDPSFDAKKIKREPESPHKTDKPKKSNKDLQRTGEEDTEQNFADENNDTENFINMNTEPQNPKDHNEVNTDLQTNVNTEQNPIDVNTPPQDPTDANLTPPIPMDAEEPQVSTDGITDAESAYEADTDPPSPSNAAGEDPQSPDAVVKKEPQTPDDKKDVKKDLDAANPGSSHDPPGSSTDGAAPAKQPARPRERCIYGANCYRKNPQHKVEFSHPSEADYGSGATAPCPYGAACRRADPRHWTQHDHPPGTLPPNPHRPHQGNPVKKRQRKVRPPSESEESDPDTPSPDLIVHGKRKRKTVKRESWSDSEEETKDPYATDESDEWMND